MAKRKIGSIKNELIIKSREAMLSAVQIFNNPNMFFKSESFIVLAIISWTYLLHAHYRSLNHEYRYTEQQGQRRKFQKTKNGAYKYWELERCLNDEKCPIDSITKENIKFLIGLRHEIEHQMTTKIDDYLSARLQACCLNYNNYIKNLFGESYGIERHLSFSLQFSSISEDQLNNLKDFDDLPANISSYMTAFDEQLDDDVFNNPVYSYRVLYVPKLVNHKGQADRVIEFISADSDEGKQLNKEFVVLREKEKKKYLPSRIVDLMKKKGYKKFNAHKHTLLWKEMDAKNPNKNNGTLVEKTWYWYETWLKEVEKHCRENAQIYK